MSYTINPNAKNKWARNADNTMDLSLETDASSVYLDNGRTLEQEIGEGSMVSNVTIVDSAMSKIIDGTLDGAYESGVMYGRSLVNIKKTVEAITMTGSGQYKGFHLRSADMIQDLKTDTDYLFVVNVTSNTLEGSTQYSLDFGNTDPNNPSQQAYFTARHYLPYNALGTYKFVLRTKSSFENAVFVSRNQILPSCTGGSITFSYMLLEYQQGMENWDIPYFTGLCDVKMPILRNIGKNLYGGEVITNKAIDFNIGELYDAEGYNALNYYTPVSQGSTITISNEYGKLGANTFIFYNSNKEYTGFINVNGVATIPKGVCYVRAYGMSHIMMGSIQIEEGSTATTYEDHKTNILRISEEIVLREVGGVCDTYNVLTGEYVRRIGEIVLNGSENWVSWGAPEETDVKGFAFNSNIKNNNSNGNTINYVSDKFNGYSRAKFPHMNCVGICDSQTQGNILIKLKKTDVPNGTISECKAYLQAHPFTVQYKLAEPITTIVEPLTIPFAYQNGHIILESGYEGQSLLPTLEYSTVVNKTGLIENVAKTIQRQEKQLTMLEQMLIQNIINLDYNNTLLTLKNEMEEML